MIFVLEFEPVSYCLSLPFFGSNRSSALVFATVRYDNILFFLEGWISSPLSLIVGASSDTIIPNLLLHVVHNKCIICEEEI